MARWRIGATGLDREIARAIARRATPALEWPSRILTWCTDEHLVLPITAGIWLLSRTGSAGQRREADHFTTSVAVAAVLPHLMKRLIAQERPDRLEIHGRRHGIPRSGRPYDAFPSGHAMHVGAIASAMSDFAPRAAPYVWTIGGLVAATRIVLLAHWTTDVLAGLAMGIGVERMLAYCHSSRQIRGARERAEVRKCRSSSRRRWRLMNPAC